MAVAEKKYKLFKVCKELNLGMDTLSSFLEERGVKLKGPNTPISEDMYTEILEKFAREKEIADKLFERKSKKDSDSPEDLKDKTDETPTQKTSYIEAIERSIQEKAEEFSKPEEKEPEAEVKSEPVKEKPAEEVPESEPQVEAEPVAEAEEIKPEEEPKPEKKSGGFRVIDLEKAGRITKKEKSTSEEDEDSKSKKIKKKDKKRPQKPDEDVVTEVELEDASAPKDKKKKKADEKRAEKEDKRRKALEMIKREEKRKKEFSKKISLSSDDAVGARRPRKQKKKKKIDQKEVQQTVRKTLASIDDKLRKPKKRKKVKDDTGEVIEENVIYASEFISANDLANLMDVPVSDIIKKCLELGLVVSINQRLELETIELLASEWDYTVVKEEEYAAEILDEVEKEEEDLDDTEDRSPIVTVMGHVDHGKTSLLDYIRKSHVVEGESGGITQHIGAYEVVNNGRKITFLDTPGHEAFTAMRARGAQVTDIVILIIAADDQIMPQTDEALDHAKAAGVKIIIAINKIDKAGANIERIKQQLAERNVLVEDWGGNYQCAEISAKTGVGIEDLLEKVLLESEMLNLKANSGKKAKGTIIESRLDKGKGNVATVLVQNGTLRIGDPFISGQFAGRVRALYDENDKKVKSAGPSQPIQVLGFDGLPQAGDRLTVMTDERTVREISFQRQRIKREQDFRQIRLRTLDQISENIKKGGVKELRIIVKADVDGSAEALSDSLLKLSNEEVSVQVIRKAVGPISESDVLLATASDAFIVGFHVRPNIKAKELAQKENIDIRIYKVVYDAINDVKLALEGMLGTDKSEQVLGMAEIREIFKISRVGTIAGCHVKSGKINRNARLRVIRNDAEIYDGVLLSLKRFKEDVREVASGFECGLQVQNYNDLKEGDILEFYEITEVKRKLA